MLKRENQEFLNGICQDEIFGFFRICAFGDMTTDASQLTQEEEEHLFDLLDRLHQADGVSVKGIWPILSLSFKNRSGLVLMTMFYNSKVELNQVFYRKSFLKDLQTLQNRSQSPKTLHKILQILNIEPQTFLQKFNQSTQPLKKSKPSQNNTATKMYLSAQKILDQFQFDSEPEFQYYQQIQEGIYLGDLERNLSYVVQRGFELDWMVSDGDEEEYEDTISLPMKRRVNTQRVAQKKKTKRRKAKRPNPKKKKTKMMEQLKKQDAQAINFISLRRQKRRLKQTYKLLAEQFEQSYEAIPKKKRDPPQQKSFRRKKNIIDSDEEPQVKQKQNQRNKQKNNKAQRKEKNMPMRMEAENQYQNESDSKQYFFIQSDLSESDQSSQQQPINSYRYPRKILSNPHIFHTQTLSRPQPIKPYTSTSVPIPPIATATIATPTQPPPTYNQKIQNLQLKQINFPLTIPPTPPTTDQLNPQLEQQKQFNTKEHQDWVIASSNSKKEILALMRQIVGDKDCVGVGDLWGLVRMAEIGGLGDYVETHVRPILQYKLVKILAGIIADVVSILYTSSTTPITLLQKSCNSLLKLTQFPSYSSSQKPQKSPMSFSLNQSLKQIFTDFQSQKPPTISKVALARPIQVIRENLRIKLNQEDFQETLLIALMVVWYGFLGKVVDGGGGGGGKGWDGLMKGMLRKRVQKNPKFLNYISEIYSIYNVRISQKQQLDDTLSLANQIPLQPLSPTESPIPLLCTFTQKTLQTFITSKTKQNCSHRSILSYILRNEFLDNCQKPGAGEVGYQITLKKYEVILRFQRFWDDMTIGKILEFFDGVDFGGNLGGEFYGGVLGVLGVCYRVKMGGTGVGGLGRESWEKSEKIKEAILGYLEKILKTVCEKYEKYDLFQSQIQTKHPQPTTTQKKQKYSKILTQFFQTFLQPSSTPSTPSTPSSPQHYLFSLKLLLSHIFPLLTKISKQDSFTISLTQRLLKCVYQIEEVFMGIRGEVEKCVRDGMGTGMMDQEEEMEFLLRVKQEGNGKIGEFLGEVGKVVAGVGVWKKMGREFLGFQQMKKYRQNTSYETYGTITALSLLDPTSTPLKQTLQKTLSQHLKQIKLDRSSRPYKSTNRLILQYIKGLFKTVKMLAQGPYVRVFEDLGREVREGVLDLGVVGLGCERDGKFVVELIQMLYKIPGFAKHEHLLTILPLPKLHPQQSPKTDLDLYLTQLSQNPQKIPNSLMFRLLQKFNVPIFNTMLKLYRQCEQIEWKQMQAFLAVNLLSIFVFLLGANVGEGIVKGYRCCFGMGDVGNGVGMGMGMGGNWGKGGSVLLGVDIGDIGGYSGQHKIIELFRIIYDTERTSLYKTVHEYFRYISNQQIKSHESTNPKQPFPKLKLLLQCLHQAPTTPTSTKLSQILLSTFLSQSLLTESSQAQSLHFFLTLFKKYPNFNKVYMELLQINLDKMEKIMKIFRVYFLGLGVGSIEEIIKKYVIGEFCDFLGLLDVLRRRVGDGRIGRDEKDGFKDVVEKCVRVLENIDKGSNRELIDKYTQLWLKLSQRKITHGIPELSFKQFQLLSP